MLYSDCLCDIGNSRTQLCATFTSGKNIGFGAFGAFLGLLTSIMMYLLFDGIFNHGLACFHVDDASYSINMKGGNQVVPEESVLESEYTKKPQEKVQQTAPAHRHRKCYACIFKHALLNEKKNNVAKMRRKK